MIFLSYFFFSSGVDLDEMKQESSFSKFIFDLYVRSYFWSRKVFGGFQMTSSSCIEKAFLINFMLSKIMIECQKAILVHLQIVSEGTFGPLEQL